MDGDPQQVRRGAARAGASGTERASADSLVDALKSFDSDSSAIVAVVWGESGAFCSGWDLKFASTLADRDLFQRNVVDGLAFPTGANAAPRGPLGPTRLELAKPVIAAGAGA